MLPGFTHLDNSTHANDAPIGATARIEAILAAFNQRGEITLGELFDAMEERAYGLLLLLLALPCCLPFVYLLPQIVALPMLVLAGQLALGRQSPWLPQGLRQRRFQVASLVAVIERANPYLKIAEWVAYPRLGIVTNHVGSRVVGALLLVPTASILVPLPLTNTMPGIGVAVASVGLIERDGLLVLAGLVVGLLWVAALVIGGQAAISFLIDFARQMF